MPEVQLTLDNCDQEPIHVPGAVQPHGVLLALAGDELRVRQASDNVEAVLGIRLDRIFEMRIDDVLDARSAELVRANRAAKSWKQFNPIAADVNGKKMDAVVHRSNDWLIVELEPTSLVTAGTYRDYAAHTHHAMLRLQGTDSLAELLHRAAESVREVTGYDRVMIYRFSEEGHGQVVAEKRSESLEAFLGLHYPASDIPAQARRLYLANWLRIIPDIEYRRSEIVRAKGDAPAPPLDLTHSTLRSVSPIHLEYLRNMGVGASMSVSLVCEGKLWGLIACHHYSPKFVPYALRLTCELVGQILSTLIVSQQRQDEAYDAEAISQRRVRLLERLHSSDYFAAGLAGAEEDFLGVVGATGAAILEDNRYTAVGACPPEDSVRALARWLADEKHESLHSSRVSVEFPGAPPFDASVAGVLALALAEHSVVVWFRPPVEETVSWAGNPEKTYAEGPNGPRLSPRGSFQLWQETVKNQSERWSHLQLAAAEALRIGVMRFTLEKSREVEHSRDMLIGMVSHDLRNPLGAISLAAGMLQDGETHESVTRTSARIAASSDRMRRMIEQLLDYTRARAGTLDLNLMEIDLVTLCRQLAEEVEGAHPGSNVVLSMPEACRFRCDPDRVAQAISNLLGNARHHGDPTRPIELQLECSEADATVTVRNHGSPIPADRLAKIFEPFKRPEGNRRSHKNAGLGLGLFIVRNLVELHGGQVALASSSEDGTVCTLRFPRTPSTQPGGEK